MSDKPKQSKGKGARAERLAAALKANLRKRKAQTRERARTDAHDGTARSDVTDTATPLAESSQKDD